MLKKCMCLLLVVGIVHWMGIETKAAEQTGSVRIVPVWCGTPVAGGTVAVNWVGERTPDGALLTDGLANWQIQESEFSSGDWLSWLAQKNTGKEITGIVEKETGAVFTDLPTGVYLVKQLTADGQYKAFDPFYFTIPEEGSWQVYREPKVISMGESPKTGDRPAPIIGAMGIGLCVAFVMVLAEKFEK